MSSPQMTRIFGFLAAFLAAGWAQDEETDRQTAKATSADNSNRKRWCSAILREVIRILVFPQLVRNCYFVPSCFIFRLVAPRRAVRAATDTVTPGDPCRSGRARAPRRACGGIAPFRRRQS